MNTESLFQSYTDADTEWNNCKRQLEVLVQKRSEVVAAIAEAVAPKKRVILPSGEVVSIVCRKHKGGKTWFFKGANKEGAADLAALMNEEDGTNTGV